MDNSSRDHAPTADIALDAIRRSLLENVRWEIWKEVAYAFDLAVVSAKTAAGEKP